MGEKEKMPKGRNNQKRSGQKGSKGGNAPKKDARPSPERMISVAFSDLVLCAVSVYCADLCMKGGHVAEAVLYFGLVALASGVGVLRFGLAPSLFFGLHKTLVIYCTNVCIPLLGFAITARTVPLTVFEMTRLSPQFFLWVTGAILFALSPTFPGANKILTLSGLAYGVYNAYPTGAQEWNMTRAAAIHGLGARFLFVRGENWFHYIYAISHIAVAM